MSYGYWGDDRAVKKVLVSQGRSTGRLADAQEEPRTRQKAIEQVTGDESQWARPLKIKFPRKSRCV